MTVQDQDACHPSPLIMLITMIGYLLLNSGLLKRNGHKQFRKASPLEASSNPAIDLTSTINVSIHIFIVNAF